MRCWIRGVLFRLDFPGTNALKQASNVGIPRSLFRGAAGGDVAPGAFRDRFRGTAFAGIRSSGAVARGQHRQYSGFSGQLVSGPLPVAVSGPALVSSSARKTGERPGRFQRYGALSLLLAWMPVVGDPLTFVAGLMRVRFWLFLTLVAVGKATRYAVWCCGR